MKISRLMSTQHPDNVTIPTFAENTIMNGDDEIKEAFYTFSTLGIDEQLWDAEGKETDNFVVKKLLSRYPEFFQGQILGKDKFLTMRVPNPEIEKDEGKILLEALHSIPRNFDLGKKFYHDHTPPIFEVVLPMCSSERGLIRIHEYYKRFIIAAQKKRIYDKDITIAQWLGDMQPENIRVTPLFETKEAILNADKYLEKYIRYEKIKEVQRVWFARSDPALNYGSMSNVLLVKIALQRIQRLQEKLSLEILPILGCGSAPFRGNFRPTNVENMLKGYPSVQTFTAQSAFKYDFPLAEVQKGIKKIKNTTRKEPPAVDEEFGIKLITKMEQDYQGSIRLIAPMVEAMSKHVPQRRKRKLHIDLFGYARQTTGIHLPRAIPFCASLYSLGLPPDVLGLAQVTSSELEKVRGSYTSIDNDMRDALQYFNQDNLRFFPPPLQKKVLHVLSLFDHEINQEHKEITSATMKALQKGKTEEIVDGIVKSGKIRQFLG